MDYSIFEKEEFNCLTKKQKEILKDVLEMSKNAPPGEAVSIIMRVLPVMEGEGALSPQQKSAIMLAIIETMTPEEKERATYLFRMAGII